MIKETAHVWHSFPVGFCDLLNKKIYAMQSRGLKVEVQYQRIDGGFSALVIGRSKEIN